MCTWPQIIKLQISNDYLNMHGNYTMSITSVDKTISEHLLQHQEALHTIEKRYTIVCSLSFCH